MMMLDAALEYARRGWRVLPCDGKLPRCMHGVHDATVDESIIRRWWLRWPDADIGIATGDGLCVLDVDVRHGGDTSLREIEHEYGEILTLTVRTGGGGLHLFLAGDLPQRVGFRAGLDLKSDGGYVVAPPSMHASGRRYAWIDELPTEPQPVPAWLATIVDPPRPERNNIIPFPSGAIGRARYIERAVEAECMAVAFAPEGERNARLNRAAFALARFVVEGVAHEAPVREALTIAAHHCGLPDHEIGRTIDSAFRARSVA